MGLVNFSQMKILFYASYPDQPIGYSKVANVLSNFLASQENIELVYMGIANYPHVAVKDRTIDPRIRFIDVLEEERKIGSKEEYGVDILNTILDREEPDVFFLYNDIIVTCRLFNEMAKKKRNMKVVCYLDLVYPFERAEFIQHMDRNSDLVFVFSECWKKNLMEMRVSPEKLRILPHGFHTELFRHIPKQEARKILGISPTDFVFLNTNRNTYRKAQDITIGGFLSCLKKEQFDPRLKLFFNCAPKTSNGYDLTDVLEVECLKRNMDIQSVLPRIITFPNHMGGNVSDSIVNALYCATDVGVNSCTGEGFGLCSMEHAALGVPQIVSAVGALPDIFEEGAILVYPRVWIHTSRALDEHTGEQGICSAEDFGEAMSRYVRDKDLYESHANWLRQNMANKFNWSAILRQFQTDFNTFFASK
jgi:glycosyltransferase involved in cell wall biosynthesis